jgi:hypothetical protein
MSNGGTGTSDPHYALISVVYHALQGAETVDQYIGDAERAGDNEAASFLRSVKQDYEQTAEQGKQLLVARIQHTH